MANEAYNLPWPFGAAEVWPPDDSEESVVGTDLHQMTIMNLRWGINGEYRPWGPDASGQWRSEEIAVAFGIEGALAAVYTHDGERQLREGEVSRELAHLRRLVEQLRQQQQEPN